MSREDEILEKVAARAADAKRRVDLEIESTTERPRPLADPSFFQRLERDLGFGLPRLLKRLYAEIGDGGFGPGAGLFGAKSGHWTFGRPLTLAELYHLNHKGGWPDKLVPICDWGCGLYSCIDCSESDYPMMISDPNWNDPVTGKDRHGFLPEGLCFADWIEVWADGIDLWRRFEQRER